MVTAEDPGVYQIENVEDVSRPVVTAAMWPADTSASTLTTSGGKAEDAAGGESEPRGKSPKPALQQVDPSADAAAHIAPFVQSSNFVAEDQVVCKDCKSTVTKGVQGTRLISKRLLTYQCGKCNSSCTKMTYALGKWPTEEFKEWDAESKVAFFRKGREGGDVRKEYVTTLIKRRFERKINQDRCELRPLEYWSRQGYDAERIESFTAPEDRHYTDQTGWEYRVNVNIQMSETELEREIQDELKKLGKRNAVKADGN